MTLSDGARRNVAWIAVAVVALVASIPLFSSYLIIGRDTYFHLYRILGIADALAKGDFPVRMQYVQADGYGYPVSLCYGDLFLYVPAALVLMGVSVTRAYALFAFLVNVVTAVIAYLCFKRVFRTRSLGVVGAALWTLAPYRLVDVYARGAVGEYVAMTFLPLIMVGAYLVFTRRQDTCTRWGWVWGGVGIACVIYSHVLTAVFVAILCVVAVIVGLIFKHDRATVLNVGKTILCALLLACAFIVPFLDFTSSNELRMTRFSLLENIEKLDNRALQPMQLFMLTPSMSGQIASVRFGVQDEMAQNIGWAILGGVLVWICAIAVGACKGQSAFRRTVAIVLVSASGVLMVLTTTIVPWDQLPVTGPFRFITDFMVNVQFQFRFLGPISFMLIIVACMGLQDLRASSVRVANVIACVLTAFALVECGLSLTTILEDPMEIRFGLTLEEDYPSGSGWGVMAGEYLPKALPYEEIPAAAPYGGVEDWQITEDGTRLAVEVDVGDEDGSLTLGRSLYAQYRVEPTADFSGSVALSSLAGTLKLDFAAGSQGTVVVWFDIPLSWNIALGVSYATVVALIAYGLLARRRFRGRGGGGALTENASAPAN